VPERTEIDEAAGDGHSTPRADAARTASRLPVADVLARAARRAEGTRPDRVADAVRTGRDRA
jgi:hypothetical protein